MKKAVALAAIIALLISACSSLPPGEVQSLRRQAEKQLELGSKEADRANLTTALFLLDEAMRLSVAADDPGLRIRVGLCRGNALFSMGRGEEASLGWNQALAEAEKIGNAELAAVCRIHIARGRLLSPDGKSAAQSVRDEVNRNLGQIRSDQFYIAFGWMVVALAERELGNYPKAEAAAQRSLDIHKKKYKKRFYYEMAAYDCFIIASSRSLAGNYNGARQSLEMAIDFDRKVENSWGLASDWRAIGDVEKKAGNRDAARAAYTRAAEIFRAVNNEPAATDALSRID